MFTVVPDLVERQTMTHGLGTFSVVVAGNNQKNTYLLNHINKEKCHFKDPVSELTRQPNTNKTHSERIEAGQLNEILIQNTCYDVQYIIIVWNNFKPPTTP